MFLFGILKIILKENCGYIKLKVPPRESFSLQLLSAEVTFCRQLNFGKTSDLEKDLLLLADPPQTIIVPAVVMIQMQLVREDIYVGVT